MNKVSRVRIVLQFNVETGRRGVWTALVHRIRQARRATGGFLASHASRFSIGCRFPACGILLIDEPLWRAETGVRNTSPWDYTHFPWRAAHPPVLVRVFTTT